MGRADARNLAALRKLANMPSAPDKIPDNIDFAARELLEAPADQRAAMLEAVVKALTRRLLQDEPGIGAHEVSEQVAARPLSLA
jgi:hypothetical protein